MNKIPIDQIVIVEGKYDKIALDNIIDATVIPCDGFGIFKNEEQRKVLRALAKERGAIILTDSDRSGAVIRSHLQTILQGADVHILLAPAVPGKEKRKPSYSKEGLLGIEGISADVLRELFNGFRSDPISDAIKPIDLYNAGLSGSDGAKERRLKLLETLNLPPHLSNNLLLKELNRRFSVDEFYTFINKQK